MSNHYNLPWVELTPLKRFPTRPESMALDEFKKQFPEPLDIYYSPLADTAGMWSAKTLPAIGDRVHVLINGLGMGAVESYFIESEWLGVTVRLDHQPEWHKKQRPNNPIAMVFGLEIQQLTGEKVKSEVNHG